MYICADASCLGCTQGMRHITEGDIDRLWFVVLVWSFASICWGVNEVNTLLGIWVCVCPPCVQQNWCALHSSSVASVVRIQLRSHSRVFKAFSDFVIPLIVSMLISIGFFLVAGLIFFVRIVTFFMQNIERIMHIMSSSSSTLRDCVCGLSLKCSQENVFRCVLVSLCAIVVSVYYKAHQYILHPSSCEIGAVRHRATAKNQLCERVRRAHLSLTCAIRASHVRINKCSSCIHGVQGDESHDGRLC